MFQNFRSGVVSGLPLSVKSAPLAPARKLGNALLQMGEISLFNLTNFKKGNSVDLNVCQMERMHRTSLLRQKCSILSRTIVALCSNVQASFNASTPICFYLKGTHLTDIAFSLYPSCRLVPHESIKEF